MSNLKETRKYDKTYGGSKIGPHKSDFIFYTKDNFLVSQLSTGQQKTIILLLLFAQIQYLIKEQNQRPIVLFDEICSHLDEIRVVGQLGWNEIQPRSFQSLVSGGSVPHV